MNRLASILALSALLCLGCGGGASSSSSPVPNATISGVYTGTVHSNSTGADYAVHALVLPNNTFRYVASNWAEAVGSATVSGNSISGSGSLYVPPSSIYSLTVSASVSSGVVSGTFGGGDSGTLYLTPDANANVSVQASQLPGTYQAASGYASTGQTTNAGINGSGLISGSDPYGTFTGSLTQVAINLNAFSVSISYTPTGGSAIAYSGYAVLEPGAPQHILVQTTSSTGVFAADFTYTGP